MEPPEEFYTAAGYRSRSSKYETESMEDYLEMICRACGPDQTVRVSVLAARLNVNPSSATKMAAVLRDAGLVCYERYGAIRLTQAGHDRGAYLLRRHTVLSRFFHCLNRSDPEEECLRQVEQVEHFLSEQTVEHLEQLTAYLEAQHYGEG